MKNQIYVTIFSLIFICCNPNKNADKEYKSVKNNSSMKVDTTTNRKLYVLPIHGELDSVNLSKYYPKVTDTIKDLRIIGSEIINVKPGNGILVSLLHNTGTFGQMIICTHNKEFDLIDNLYIGKATGFDNGKSHTIEYFIINDNEIVFNQIDWRFVGEEIEPVKKTKMSICINENGKIKYTKTIPDNVQKQ